MAELRWNPLKNDWVMINSNRQSRPVMPVGYCPFCPGPDKNKLPLDYDVLKYDNDFPALSQNPPEPNKMTGDSKIYLTKPMYGKCEIILFSPEHDSSLCDFSVEHIQKIVNLWIERFTEISKDENIKYIFIFENRGELVGVTQPHPHGQIYGYSVIPKKIELKIDCFKSHYEKNKSCMFCDINIDEIEFKQRIVYENEDFIAYIPFFAEYVYQVFIISKTHKSNITQFKEQEKKNFALALKMITGMYDNLFDKKFPYMMCMHNNPVNFENVDKYFHFHVEFYTPLRSANVQQFNASSETGVWAHCNPSSPEEKAEELRNALNKFQNKIKTDTNEIKKENDMTILVTGGAGYIGSHCIKILNDKGYKTIAVDNLTKGHEKSLQISDTKFYNGDVGDKNLLNKIFKENKIDGVMHFAAYSIVPESQKKPYEYYKNNVGSTLELLNAMVENNVKYIVFSSTASTYGIPKNIPVTEDDEQKPINTYGETKLAIEKMLACFDRAHDLKYVALRYFNVAGAYKTGVIGEDHTTETHLIPIILQVANGKRDKIEIYGDNYDTPDGTNIRDYIHVEDLIDAHIKAFEYLKKENKSNYFNLGSGGGYSNLEIVNAVRKVTGHSIPCKIAERRPGDPDTLIASSEKAEKILGWTREYKTIENIIESAWKWHQKHPDGYKD